MKQFIRKIINVPLIKVLVSGLRRNKGGVSFKGDFETWAAAESYCSGYASELILEKCKNALLKVKNKEAVYERDSVLFDKIEYSWGLLAGLQRAALENKGKLCVLDFGGSLGSTYYQNKDFLDTLSELRWCIVEQQHFVECGKEFFENEQLKFFYTLEECIEKYKPDMLVFSSVLQYLEKPYEVIDKCISLGIPNIVIDRTAFIDGNRDILAVQTVPESIYTASYPVWFFNKAKMDEKFGEKYDCLGTFSSHEGYVIDINNSKSHYQGMIWKMK